MPPKVDDIIQTTTVDDIIADYGLDDFDLDNYNNNLNDFDLDNYDNDLNDFDLDSFDPDNYLDDYGLNDDDSGDFRDLDDFGSDDLHSGGLSEDDDTFDLDRYEFDDSYSSNLSGYGNSDVWYIAAAGIHGVGLLAFVVLLLATLFVGLRRKNKRNDGTKPVKSIALSLVSLILWSIFAILSNLTFLNIELGYDGTTAVYILTVVWSSIAQIMIFSIFYRLLNDRFNRLATTSGFHKFVRPFNWVALGLLTILFVVRIILNALNHVKWSIGADYNFVRIYQFNAALSIIAWIAALVILVFSVIAFVKTRSSLGGSVASPIALIIAAFAFFIDWLVVMIISIRFTLMSVPPPRYIIIPETVFAIVCPVVMYIAFIVIIAKSDPLEAPMNQAAQPQGPVQYQQPVEYQQPMGETQYQQPQPQYSPAPDTSPVPFPQPTPPPHQFPGTPPAQTQYAQPQAGHAQPQFQYAQVPVPAAYPSQSPHPQ